MSQPPSRLHRALGVRGATVVGLSAMLGTGVFAVWTPAWSLAGSWLLLGLGIAAVVAVLNAISTARLAAVHPEAGGAYAYGRIRLSRGAGLTAGLAFLVGKGASAAAAALTIGVYAWPGQERLVAWLAIAVALAIDLRGVVKSTRVNAVLVAVVIAVVLLVVGVGLVNLPDAAPAPAPPATPVAVVAAAGLLFVAFAGYARIAVLGEEVRDPARTIPLAMAASFAIVLVLYAAVGATIALLAGRGLALGPAALEAVAALSGSGALEAVVRVAAVLGAGSVLISLLAGMGRTLFAMASAGDAPRALAAVSSRSVPHRAAVLVALWAAVVVLAGQLSWALALSGFSILGYYSVAHLAAWTLPPGKRPWRVVPVLGLVGCVAVLGSLAGLALTGGLPAG
jgi:basic amino acid/polyamine antiporter, APA family